MRTGRSGKWWVLANGPGVFWTGETIPTTVDKVNMVLGVFAMDKAKAQQFADPDAAAFCVLAFGLPSGTAPVELEFAA